MGLTQGELQAVASILGVDASDDFVGLILDQTASDLDERLSVMKKAVSAKDSSSMFRTAHAIKGSAAQAGLAALSSPAAELETLFDSKGASAFDSSEFSAHWDALLREASRVCETQKERSKA